MGTSDSLLNDILLCELKKITSTCIDRTIITRLIFFSRSGYRVQGKDAPTAHTLLHAAHALQSAGACLLVLEAVPHRLATYITRTLRIPTIGIGAGPGCSGQVLVHDDALGIWRGHQAKFVRRFAEVGRAADEGVLAYASAVKRGEFPNTDDEAYEMDEEQWALFLRMQGADPVPIEGELL